MIVVLEANCSFDAKLGVLVDTLYSRVFIPSSAPYPSRFLGVLARLAKAIHGHAATQPQL